MLVPRQEHVGDYYRASGASVGGVYSDDVWVKIGGMTPLSRGGLAGLASLLVVSVGSISS